MGLKRTVKDCVYGMAVGDALGVPYEFLPRGSFTCTGMVGHGSHDQPAGTWSDDTSMALALCDSYRELGRVDCDDVRVRFVRWMEEGTYTVDGLFDIGGATARVLATGRGCTEESSKGNGSLMRCLPMAFMECSDADVCAVSAITHATGDCMDACVKMVGYAREALRTGRPGRASGDEPGGSSGYVWDTYNAAIWCLEHTESYRACVLAAVNLGDDTDTTACVAGGLAGILYGCDAIPVAWLDALRGKDIIDSCLFGSSYSQELLAFARRFEASLDGLTHDFEELGEAMFALGFHMDCGHSFAERYPGADSPERLRAVLQEIDDVPLLGSAVFSRWRYVTHWSLGGMPSKDDLKWFRLALRGLCELA